MQSCYDYCKRFGIDFNGNSCEDDTGCHGVNEKCYKDANPKPNTFQWLPQLQSKTKVKDEFKCSFPNAWNNTDELRCQEKGRQYKASQFCNGPVYVKKTKQEAGNEYYEFYCSREQGHCTGPETDCYEKSGQKWVEDLVCGKTIFRMFKGEVKCPTGSSAKQSRISEAVSAKQSKIPHEAVEHSPTPHEAVDTKQSRIPYANRSQISDTQLNEKYKELQNVPDKVECLIDDKMIEKKIPLNNTLVKDVCLNLCIWKHDADVDSKIGICFDANQLKKVYPEFVKRKKGFEYIVMNKKDISDNASKRLFYTVATSESLLQNIARVFNKTTLGQQISQSL